MEQPSTLAQLNASAIYSERSEQQHLLNRVKSLETELEEMKAIIVMLDERIVYLSEKLNG